MNTVSSVWRRHGAIYIFLVLWLLLSVGHFAFELVYTQQDAQEHDVSWAWSEFLVEWTKDYLENLQSEAWQVMMSAWLIERLAAKRRWFTASEGE